MVNSTYCLTKKARLDRVFKSESLLRWAFHKQPHSRSLSPTTVRNAKPSLGSESTKRLRSAIGPRLSYCLSSSGDTSKALASFANISSEGNRLPSSMSERKARKCRSGPPICARISLPYPAIREFVGPICELIKLTGSITLIPCHFARIKRETFGFNVDDTVDPGWFGASKLVAVCRAAFRQHTRTDIRGGDDNTT
jgi:hypothetical protein